MGEGKIGLFSVLGGIIYKKNPGLRDGWQGFFCVEEKLS
jgi:hypothetical protein